MDTSEWIVNDGPEDYCFGCGHRNESGLKLRFRPTGDASVETTFEVPDRYRGAQGIVHGGILATLLDEVMGMAAHVGLGDENGAIATADLRLRYRRPAPIDEELTVRGRLASRDGPHLQLEGDIVDRSGQVLTEAQARFRLLD